MFSSDKAPTYIASSGDCNSINSSFLTPPLTPRSEHDIPFRPDEKDRISLNMKKIRKTTGTHKGKRRWRRKHLRAPDVNEPDTERPYFVRSKSLGFPSKLNSGNISPGSTFMASFPIEDNARSRRWTLPSKSMATRGFTALRSIVKQATFSDVHESPAMITLRRATTNRMPKRNELTFFPEPHFSDERKSILSYLVLSFTTPRLADQFANLGGKEIRTSRSASISSDGAHPTITYPAATVCTETTVEPDITQPGIFSTKCKRRCSTKYMTETSTFEIIWDENDSSTVTRESSSPYMSERRTSLAVTKLESQLARGTASIHREPSQTRSQHSRKSTNPEYVPGDAALIEDAVAQIKQALIYKTVPPEPRALRGSSRRKATLCSITTQEEPRYETLTEEEDRLGPIFALDFFPPLPSRRASMIVSPENRDQGQQVILPDHAVLCQDKRQSVGSMLGCGSHARRRSSAFAGRTRRWNSANKSGGDTMRKIDYESVNDASPLLGTKAQCRITQG